MDYLLVVIGCLASLWIGTNSAEPECGVIKSKEALGERVTGGVDAIYGEFPFMVSIRLGGRMFGEHHCGGAIINKLWILTAAHCVTTYKPPQFKVRVGEYNLKIQDAWEVDYPIEKIVLHPQLYEPKPYNNDIALLKLAKPIEYNDYVIPTCLPKGNEDFGGFKAVIMGWGFTKETDRNRSNMLQKAEINVRNRDDCQRLYQEANKKVTFNYGQFCAGVKDGSKDSCQGDSGGPLTVKRGDHYTVIGVVSAGIGCGRAFLPGIYTEVSKKMDWITETIA